MSAFFKAELKDKFLQYALDTNDYFQIQLLYDEFLRPNYSLEFAEKLIREIIDYNPELIDIMSGNGAVMFMISATKATEEFLEESGFKNSYIAEEEKWDVLLDQIANTRKLSVKEKENLGRVEKTDYKRERKLLYFLMTAVSISFLFTLFSIVKYMFTDAKGMSNQVLEERISKIELENKKERQKLEKELEVIKASLNNNATSK